MAVPCTVTVVPLVSIAPADGLVIVVVGPWVSEDLLAATSPDMTVVADAPMSASTLMVACWIRGSAAAPSPSWFCDNPHAHWMVPAPKTSAPLLAR